METRSVTLFKVYLLIMNSIFSRAEQGEIVAVSTDYDKLVQWYQDQKCDQWEDNSYGDHTYTKNFKKGSDLENYNPCNIGPESAHDDIFSHGIKSEWIDERSFNSLGNRFNLIYSE